MLVATEGLRLSKTAFTVTGAVGLSSAFLILTELTLGPRVAVVLFGGLVIYVVGTVAAQRHRLGRIALEVYEEQLAAQQEWARAAVDAAEEVIEAAQERLMREHPELF